jgi:hypothetical protein
MVELDRGETYRQAAASSPRVLSWSRTSIADPVTWQDAARLKLTELCGYGRFGGPPAILHQTDLEPVVGYCHREVCLRVRHGHDIVLRLVWRDGREKAMGPAVICLQGGDLGVGVSWGEGPGVPETAAIAQGADFACQAADHGYLAVCVAPLGCAAAASTESGEESLAKALLLGRSPAGEYASDVASTLNWMLDGESRFQIDPNRVAVAGWGTGGFAAIVAMALDPRFSRGILVNSLERLRSRAVQDTIDLSVAVPGMLRWLDVDDVLCLCAPRSVLAAATRDCDAERRAEMTAVLQTGGRFYDRLEAPDRLDRNLHDWTPGDAMPVVWGSG